MPPRILIVDDDPDTLSILQVLLQHQGFETTTAGDGNQALASAFANPPDAVLLDMMMPGLDGLEVCRRLRADPRTATLPIIAVTARVGWDNRAEGLQAGIDDYVTKPFDPEDLSQRLKAALAGRSSPGERIVSEMMQALLVTLGCHLVWLLAADTERNVLTTVAAASAPTEARARKFIQNLPGAGEGGLSYADGVFGAFMQPGQARLAWPLSDVSQMPHGHELAAALNLIEVRVISAVPILARGKPAGLLIYDTPRLRAESGQLAALAANVAAAALANHHLVADLRHSEERAQAERAFRQMILDTMGEGILVLDAQGQIEFVNQRLARLTGYTEAELIGQPASVLMGAAHTAAQAAAGTTSLESQIRRKNGDNFPAELLRTPRPGRGGQVVLVADLSAEKRVQAELYQQNRRLDALIQATRTMTSSLNLSEVPGRILEEAARVLDVECGAILLVHPAEDHPGLLCAAATGPGTEGLPGRSLPPGTGIAGWVAQTGLPALVDDVRLDPRLAHGIDTVTGLNARSLLAVPMRATSGVIGVVELLNKRAGPFSAADRTLLESLALSAAVAIGNAQLYTRLEASAKALAESQTRLVRAEKLAATGRMAAMLAHEINNPLQSVRTALSLAARPELPAADRQRCLTLALGETERITGLLQRMLEIHRPHKVERAPVDLRAIAEKVLALAEARLHEHNIEVTRDWPASLPAVTGVADQLTQVFLNLVLNACDAMPQSGKLRLSLRQLANGDGVLAEVADTGPGIPAEALEKIFEPFFTTKSTGTGLGLAVSQDIVDRHGGRLEVESEPGLGSVFRISLPLDYRPAPP
jgi:two-component system NtrC family sensor kinase